jgi:hypothetical protein
VTKSAAGFRRTYTNPHIRAMTKEQPEYLSYLLRLWRTEGVGQAAIWHASLEDPRSGASHHFASLEEAVAFLQEQMGRASQPTAGRDGHPNRQVTG